MDFTLSTYRKLLTNCQHKEYSFLSFEQFCILQNKNCLPPKFIIIRHDIDKRPKQSLIIATLENHLKIKSSFFCRTNHSSCNTQIIKSIADLKHEIGYHYEDYNKQNGIYTKSLQSFQRNLSFLRTLYPVRTVCMHGNPSAKYNEGLLWDQLKTTKLGLLGEPYHSIDFDTVFYLTDTGRRWDGYKVSIWDKVPQQELWNKQGLTFHSTQDIIRALEENRLPNQVMITTHPQRWTDNYLAWVKELIVQSLKNIIKRGIIILKSKKEKQ